MSLLPYFPQERQIVVICTNACKHGDPPSVTGFNSAYDIDIREYGGMQEGMCGVG